MLPVNWQYWRTQSGRRPSRCISPAIRFWPADIVHSPRLPLGVWISLPNICGNHFEFQTCRWVGLEPYTCKIKATCFHSQSGLSFSLFFLGGRGALWCIEFTYIKELKEITDITRFFYQFEINTINLNYNLNNPFCTHLKYINVITCCLLKLYEQLKWSDTVIKF